MRKPRAGGRVGASGVGGGFGLESLWPSLGQG